MARTRRSHPTPPDPAAEDVEARSVGAPTGLSCLLSAAAATTGADLFGDTYDDAEDEDADGDEAVEAEVSGNEDVVCNDGAGKPKGDDDEMSYTSIIGRKYQKNWSDSEDEDDYNTNRYNDLSSARLPKAPKMTAQKDMPRLPKEPTVSSRTSKNLLLKWGQDCAAVADSYREELKNKDNEISRYSKAATDIMKAKDKELKKKTAELRKAKAQTLLYKGKAQDEKIEKQSLKKEMNRLQKSISNRDSEIERNKAGHTRELQAMKMKLMKAENAAAEAKAKSKKNKSARGTEQGEEKAALMYEKHRLTEERKEAEHRRKIELEQSRRASKKAKFEFANQGGAGCGMHGAPSDFRNMAAPYGSMQHMGMGPSAFPGFGGPSYGYSWNAPGNFGHGGYGQGPPPCVTPRVRDGPPMGIAFDRAMDDHLSQLTGENAHPNEYDVDSCHVAKKSSESGSKF